VTPLVRFAARVATTSELDPTFRLQAIAVLSRLQGAGSGEVLLGLMRPAHPQPVQVAAARAIATLDDYPISRSVFESWARHGTAARQEVLASAVRSKSATEALLTALEEKSVAPSEIPSPVRVTLCEARDPATRTRAATLLAGASFNDRQGIVANYQHAASISGDRVRGAALFQDHCITCHAIQGRGGRVGPDLSGVGSRRNDLLLVDILYGADCRRDGRHRHRTT
jgi:mono/diheme cytochrome c family protein